MYPCYLCSIRNHASEDWNSYVFDILLKPSPKPIILLELGNVWKEHHYQFLLDVECFWKGKLIYIQYLVKISQYILVLSFVLLIFCYFIAFLYKNVLVLCWETWSWSLCFCPQAAPLDICFDSFYTSRKEMIDRRLEEITAAPVEVDECYCLHYLNNTSQYNKLVPTVVFPSYSETSGNAGQNVGLSWKRALYRPQLGSVHKCRTSKGVSNSLYLVVHDLNSFLLSRVFGRCDD